MKTATFTPIGIVHNPVARGSGKEIAWENVESEIEVDAAWTDALDGLEEFSHLFVVFWLDRAPPPPARRTRPQQRADLPLVGVFATRTPVRPNPIGIKVVELLARDKNILRVRGLDAWDQTPVLDLKPYLPRDAIPDARAPEWVKEAWRSR
jgi:tRNA-Thr(GGU) m(6)t(6)A37 methyltransferase TsaA